MGFSENLKAIRTAKGLTQEQLAKKLGVQRQSIVEWENPNGKRPDFLNLVCLVTALEVSWNRMMDGEVQTVKDNVPEWKHMEGIAKALQLFAQVTGQITKEAFHHNEE